jgi:hypothetical protein
VIDAATEPSGAVFVSPARRCSECHTKIAEDWHDSRHAGSDSKPLYLAMKTASKASTCDGCHAPLRGRVPKSADAQNEGVTCDVCHSMNAVADSRFGGDFTMRLDDNVKYGPICDAKAPYFHKTACLPLHEDSKQCSACHLFRLPAQGGRPEIPVITDYEDWKASNSGATGISCQTCHMPGGRAEVAVGAGQRSAVSAHLFAQAPSGGVEWTVNARADGDNVRIDVELKNAGAGHMLPGGLAGRRIVLRVTPSGGARQEKEFARILVDATGAEVPFYEAAKVQRDTRLEPNRARIETFSVPIAQAAPKSVIAVDLVRLDVAPAVAAKVGAPSVEVPLRRAQIELGDDIRKVKGALKVAPVGP